MKKLYIFTLAHLQISKSYNYLVILLSFNLLILVLTGCEQVAVKNTSEAKKLLTKIYPKKMQCDYELVTLYASKDNPATWAIYEWKRNNDYLEKKGLLKQIVVDTTIQFYDRVHSRFGNKEHYLYRIKMSNELKSLISDSQSKSRAFDEYDYDNTKTGKQAWLNCKVVCGMLTLDTIVTVEQNDPPFASLIKYYEKFAPTVFNELVGNAMKFHNGEKFFQSIVAKKYDGEECKLVY